MSQARCFTCEKKLPANKPMEEIARDNLPIFCSNECAVSFPVQGTSSFKRIMRKFMRGEKNR